MDILFYFFLTYFLFDMTPEQKEFQAKYERLREIFKTNPALNKDLDASTVELLKKAKTHYQKLQSDENPSDGMVQKVAYTAPPLPKIGKCDFVDTSEQFLNSFMRVVQATHGETLLDKDKLFEKINTLFLNNRLPIGNVLKTILIDAAKVKPLTITNYTVAASGKIINATAKSALISHYKSNRAAYKNFVLEEITGKVTKIKVEITHLSAAIPNIVPVGNAKNFIEESAVGYTDPTTKKKGTYVTHIIGELQAAEAELGATDLYASIPFADATLRADLKNRLNNILSGLGDAIISHKGFEISTYKISRETIIAEVDAFCKDKKYIEAVYDKANPAADIPPTISSNFFVNCFANKKHQIIPENAQGVTMADFRKARETWSATLPSAYGRMKAQVLPAGVSNDSGLLVDFSVLQPRLINIFKNNCYSAMQSNQNLVNAWLRFLEKTPSPTLAEVRETYDRAIKSLGIGYDEKLEYNLYLWGLGVQSSSIIWLNPDTLVEAVQEAVVCVSEEAFVSTCTNWVNQVRNFPKEFRDSFPYFDKVEKTKLLAAMKNIFPPTTKFVHTELDKYLSEIKEDIVSHSTSEHAYNQFNTQWIKFCAALTSDFFKKEYANLSKKFANTPKEIEIELSEIKTQLPQNAAFAAAFETAYYEVGADDLEGITIGLEAPIRVTNLIGTEFAAFTIIIPLEFQRFRGDDTKELNKIFTFVQPQKNSPEPEPVRRGERIAEANIKITEWQHSYSKSGKSNTSVLRGSITITEPGIDVGVNTGSETTLKFITFPTPGIGSGSTTVTTPGRQTVRPFTITMRGEYKGDVLTYTINSEQQPLTVITIPVVPPALIQQAMKYNK